jgi:chromosome segregation ATPase
VSENIRPPAPGLRLVGSWLEIDGARLAEVGTLPLSLRDRLAELEDELDESLSTIEELESRLENLEQQLAKR